MRITVMQYNVIFFLILFSTVSLAKPGLAESGPSVRLEGERSARETNLPAGVVGQIEKAGNQGNKAGIDLGNVIQKLSNAVSSEYVIGAEDVLEITVWRNEDLSKEVQVRPDGKISMPIIRDIMAVGKTPMQLAEEMTNRLKQYVQNPVVAVSLKEVNSSNIFVLGEIVKPGRYPLKSKTTLLQGITIAGGFTPIAARNQIVIFRFTDKSPGMERMTASYDEIVLRDGIAENFELKSGDTLVVPSEAMVVFPGR